MFRELPEGVDAEVSPTIVWMFSMQSSFLVCVPWAVFVCVHNVFSVLVSILEQWIGCLKTPSTVAEFVASILSLECTFSFENIDAPTEHTKADPNF